jgi:hypothetical protein
MSSISKLILYINITGVSGMDVLNVITKVNQQCNPLNNGRLVQKTKERSKQIIDAGFTLIEVWKCKWLKSKEYNTTVII